MSELSPIEANIISPKETASSFPQMKRGGQVGRVVTATIAGVLMLGGCGIGQGNSSSEVHENDSVTSSMVNSVRPQLEQLTHGLPFTVTDAKEYGPKWGVITISNPTTDPAKVVEEVIDGKPQIIMGPGTDFSDSKQTLEKDDAPQPLLKDINLD